MSKKPLPKSRTKAIDAPFDPAIWARAQKIAGAYRILLEADANAGFLGRAIEFPTVFERGPNADVCVAALRTALTVAVATMLERDLPPPPPSSMAERTLQLNIRVSGDERVLLESAARKRGFRGVSDFVRSAAVQAARG